MVFFRLLTKFAFDASVRKLVASRISTDGNCGRPRLLCSRRQQFARLTTMTSSFLRLRICLPQGLCWAEIRRIFRCKNSVVCQVSIFNTTFYGTLGFISRKYLLHCFRKPAHQREKAAKSNAVSCCIQILTSEEIIEQMSNERPCPTANVIPFAERRDHFNLAKRASSQTNLQCA